MGIENFLKQLRIEAISALRKLARIDNREKCF